LLELYDSIKGMEKEDPKFIVTLHENGGFSMESTQELESFRLIGVLAIIQVELTNRYIKDSSSQFEYEER
jgi:hypothetical protein